MRGPKETKAAGGSRRSLPHRREVLTAAATLPFLASCMHGLANSNSGVAELTIDPVRPRIAFGSCVHQEKDQAIWRAIADMNPDIFIMLGDAGYPQKASYPTLGDIDAIARSYAKLAENPDFAAFSARIPMLAIWDDNDFGASDGGGDYAYKQESQRLFLDFWGSRSHVIRPIVEDGVYCAFEFGAPGRRVQVILPDLRFNRSPWVSVGEAERRERAARDIGPYAEGSPESTLLGATQWTWLERVLRREADVRVFASSIQFASEGRGWECWANFPHEKHRLLALIAEARARGVVVVSGDAHFAEVCRQDEDALYPIWDITSSGLTESWPSPGPSRNRVPGQLMNGCNFGMLELSFDTASPLIEYRIHNAGGVAALHGVIHA